MQPSNIISIKNSSTSQFSIEKLPQQDAERLKKLSIHYIEEAEKCYHARAYMGGCAMAGAALEAILMLMIHYNNSRVAATLGIQLHKKESLYNDFQMLIKDLNGRLRKRKNKRLYVRDFTLNHLLLLGRRMQWLPYSFEPKDLKPYLQKQADKNPNPTSFIKLASILGLGDYADLVRMMRNWIHPIKYMNDFTRTYVGEGHLRGSLSILYIIAIYNDFYGKKMRNNILIEISAMYLKEKIEETNSGKNKTSPAEKDIKKYLQALGQDADLFSALQQRYPQLMEEALLKTSHNKKALTPAA